MTKFNLKTALFFMLLIATSLSSCQAIESIFKAGVWVGVIASRPGYSYYFLAHK